MTDTLAKVEIPADVRDNSETVTDYAFMRHRSPDRGVVTVKARNNNISMYSRGILRGKVFTWWGTNQKTGQRCRFDMVVRSDGTVVHLFHTEYWTRVACHTGDWCHSYATHYALVIKDGEPTTDDPLPYCDEHLRSLSRELTVIKSERLLIGQHDD